MDVDDDAEVATLGPIGSAEHLPGDLLPITMYLIDDEESRQSDVSLFSEEQNEEESNHGTGVNHVDDASDEDAEEEQEAREEEAEDTGELEVDDNVVIANEVSWKSHFEQGCANCINVCKHCETINLQLNQYTFK